MANLRKMLFQEQIRLEKILRKTKEQLKDAPQGTLRLTHTKQSVQYYCSLPGEKRIDKYISKNNTELVRNLPRNPMIKRY